MQRRAARAPTGLINVAVRIFAFEQEWRSGWLDTTAPDVRTDQIVELPIGPRFKEHDLLAGFCQNCGKYRARRAGTDNHNIDFVVTVGHITSSWSARCAADKERRDARNHPWCRKPRPPRRCATGNTQSRRRGLSSRQAYLPHQIDELVLLVAGK